jgi:hypothetical protein
LHDVTRPQLATAVGVHLAVDLHLPPLISNLAPPSQCARPVAFSSASEEGVELVFDELRRVGAGGVFGLGEKGRGVQLRSVRGRLRRSVDGRNFQDAAYHHRRLMTD